MARLTQVRLQNYRSAQDARIRFPVGIPVVLLGENNAGKSNLCRGIELVLGPIWPGNHEPDDNEFFGRERSVTIRLDAAFDPEDKLGGRWVQVKWQYEEGSNEPRFLGYDREWLRYISNEDRSQCICVALHAERELDYHLSYRSKWTFLSRLMHRFHKSLLENAAVQRKLLDLFASVTAEFHNIPEFKAFVDTLQSQVFELAGSMTHRLEVDFQAYNPINFFHALRLVAKEGEIARALEELGTGEQQILAMAFAYAFAQAFHGGVVLIVEEPEAHLHPLAQQWLGGKLRRMAAGGLQILLTTHSPAFVDLLGLEGIVLVRKDAEGATTTTQLDRMELVGKLEAMRLRAGLCTPENVLPFYAKDAGREVLEGFFAKVVVLVEGPTEAAALPVLLSRVGLETAKEGIAVIPVHGKGNLAKWYRLFSVYDIPCFIVFDNDTSQEDSDGVRREEALRALGVEDGEAPNLLGTREWVVRDNFTVFGGDYEQVFRRYFSDYAGLEEQARAEGVEAKQFIARFSAERLTLSEEAPGTTILKDLAERLRRLLPASAVAPEIELEATPAAENNPFD
ncbi:MAG: hypothetical protein DCC71_00045 [Proteobacteria bacterium]|nr:MAG: hypothetical protein DCC71_00045 [Pseudomonadota bacterium]